LELGSGTGETAAYLASHSDAEIVAVDHQQGIRAEANARHRAPNLHFELFDLLSDTAAAIWKVRYGLRQTAYFNHLVVRLPMVLRALHASQIRAVGFAFIEPNFLNPYCAFIFGTQVGRRLARLEPDEMAFTPGELRPRSSRRRLAGCCGREPGFPGTWRCLKGLSDPFRPLNPLWKRQC